MLKKFFLNSLSSFLGAWIALVLFIVVLILVCIGLVARFGNATFMNNEVSDHSVLVVKLDGVIEEYETPVDFNYADLITGEITRNQALTTIVEAINLAAENRNIEAIYLQCGDISAAPATLNALRNALLEFKLSGKKIIAYGDQLSMGAYYIATVADELYLNPAGNVSLKGLGGLTPFYKGLFDKIGVDFQVVKVGTYKSAVEPYIMEHMSEPARAQLDTLYGNMWNLICSQISSRRPGLTREKIDQLINDDFIFLRSGKFAYEAGLVDGLCYQRSVDSIMAVTLSIDRNDLNFVRPEMLVSQEEMFQGMMGSEQIAIVYACGEILDGGPVNTINYEEYVPLIVNLAEDDNVKGMVLRVNSPGGSVFGSEQIGEALDYFKSKGKPLVVSMGDYAASGGYWISCCADYIFADPLTITGSIGIFGLIPNVEGLTQKIGLNFDLVSTNPQAAFPSLIYKMDDRQLAGMQTMVEEGYDQFVARVARGRNLPESEVRRIGEGRVWDAETALTIGLVDELGNLDNAIDRVANQLGNPNCAVVRYPQYEMNFWYYLPEIMNMQVKENLRMALKDDLTPLMYLEVLKTLQRKPVQARMPDMKVGFEYKYTN